MNMDSFIKINGSFYPHPNSWTDGSDDIQNFPAISSGHIIAFLIDGMACDGKSARNYRSLDAFVWADEGWVGTIVSKSFGDTVFLKASVNRSMAVSMKPYKVWAACSKTGEVYEGGCECKAGLAGVCSHVGALLFAVERFVVHGMTGKTCTDVMQTWNVGSKKNVLPGRISDMNPTTKPRSLDATKYAVESSRACEKTLGFTEEESCWKHFNDPSLKCFSNIPGSGCCPKCLGRVPFATLIASLVCIAGVSMFLVCMYRALMATMRMFELVFDYRFYGSNALRLHDVKMAFLTVGVAMGLLCLFLILLGFLTTGATRDRVYRDWKARLGGRIFCGSLMLITYIMHWIWLVVTITMILATSIFFVWTGMCNRLRDVNLDPSEKCIDLRQLDFMFPVVTHPRLHICDEGRKKEFCYDYVEACAPLYLLSTVGAGLVILSLVHFLMCLASNYSHIKDQEKIVDLELLHDLQETEMGPVAGGSNSKASVDRY